MKFYYVSLGARAVLAAGLLLVAASPASSAQPKALYVFSTFDVPGATRTAVNANSPHAIGGEFDDADGNTHGFVMSSAGFAQIDVPFDDAIYTSVNGLNANGQVVGIWIDSTLGFHGYFYDDGDFTSIDVPHSVRTQANFINAQGEVVGSYRDPSQTRHGYVWRKGVLLTTSIDFPGASSPGGTPPNGINDNGEIVGSFVDADGYRHGFLLSKGDYTSFDVPGALLTVAQGINNAGQIAGLYADDEGVSHGFVLSKDQFARVNAPNAAWTEIYSINAQGEIVGVFEDDDGVHGFVAVPGH